MSDHNPTCEEMERRTVRFSAGLGDFRKQHSARSGIPGDVFERFAPNTVFPLLIPQAYEGRSAGAPLTGLPGLVVDLTVCPPGTGPVLHRHKATTENFMCLSGQFEILWGEHGERSLTLNQFDFCSVPPGVFRTFRNPTDKAAWLLVLIQLPAGPQRDDVDLGQSVAQALTAEFGVEMISKLRAIGFEFDCLPIHSGEPT